MTKKIFPGNYINHLSSYQGQPIVAMPGRRFVHLIGYAKVDGTPRQELDIIIPSPDKRPDDKPRPDIVGMKVPNGAHVYHLGLRVPDARKDRAYGTARSGLVFGANGDRVKLATAVGAGTNVGTIANNALATPGIATGGSPSVTAAPQDQVFHPSTFVGVATNTELTLKVFNANAAGSAAGTSGLSTTEPGGVYLIAEVAYWLPDTVPGPEAFGGLPAVIESL
jgi:hypothetical protein